MGALSEAAASGDKRKMLEAMRDKLVTTIDSTESGRDVSSLMRRLLEVVNELDAMPEAEDDSPLARVING